MFETDPNPTGRPAFIIRTGPRRPMNPRLLPPVVVSEVEPLSSAENALDASEYAAQLVAHALRPQPLIEVAEPPL